MFTYTETNTPILEDEQDSNQRNIGWICPRCNRSNSPWLNYCDCDISTWNGDRFEPKDYTVTCNCNKDSCSKPDCCRDDI